MPYNDCVHLILNTPTATVLHTGVVLLRNSSSVVGVGELGLDEVGLDEVGLVEVGLDKVGLEYTDTMKLPGVCGYTDVRLNIATIAAPR